MGLRCESRRLRFFCLTPAEFPVTVCRACFDLVNRVFCKVSYRSATVLFEATSRRLLSGGGGRGGGGTLCKALEAPSHLVTKEIMVDLEVHLVTKEIMDDLEEPDLLPQHAGPHLITMSTEVLEYNCFGFNQLNEYNRGIVLIELSTTGA